MSKKKTRNKSSVLDSKTITSVQTIYDPPSLEELPVTYQDIFNYLGRFQNINPFELRLETMRRIESLTGRPLICFISKTHNIIQDIQSQTAIDDGDVTGISDLIYGINEDALDVILVSNGGSVETSERIVKLLRGKCKNVRFILPGNAYSAATLIALSGDMILMSSSATLGLIDPQINGIPARTIIRGFENVQRELASEGPQALTAYMPLLEKYSVHLLEICRSAEKLSKGLAKTWLKQFHGLSENESEAISKFFSDFDEHLSHGRTIDRVLAREKGLQVKDLEEIPEVSDLVQSLYNQYLIWFDRTLFFKAYENTRGICWGRQIQQIQVQLPSSLLNPKENVGL